MDKMVIYSMLPIFLQNCLCNYEGWRLKQSRYGRTFKDALSEYEEHNEWSYEQMCDYRDVQLRRLVRHCYETVPYYHKLFDDAGVKIIGSNFELCERSLDKFKMYNWLVEHGYKCAKSYMDPAKFYDDLEKGSISYPVFVKPSCGSASFAISKAQDKETVDLLCSHSEGMMIQEFLKGQEIGADVYIDMISKKVVSIFTKKKIVMRAGETDKAVSFKDPKLFALIQKFVEESGFTGQIDIDIFDIDGEYYISEVNPRFGGGYPHAFESGCNHMALIENNLKGIENKPNIGCYEEGVYMMKYNEIAIKKA